MLGKLIILGGCACLLAAGCAGPKGGAETTGQEGFSTNYYEGPYPGQMNAPTVNPNLNPHDMRSSEAVTPRPGPESQPQPSQP